MRSLEAYSYYVKTEDGEAIGQLVSADPLRIGDTVVYKGTIGVITDGNEVSVYMKKIGTVIELKDAPKKKMWRRSL